MVETGTWGDARAAREGARDAASPVAAGADEEPAIGAAVWIAEHGKSYQDKRNEYDNG